MLKFTNTEKTSAIFNGTFITLDAPENWESIADSSTREAVLAYLAEGNTAQDADLPPPPTPQQIADAAALTLAKANANLVLLIGATRAQIGAFCTAKFPTLTVGERDTLADMLFAIKLVAKDLLRA